MKRSMFQIILLAVFGSLAIAGILVFAFAVGGNNQAGGIGKVVIWGMLDRNAFNAMLDNAGRYNQQLQQISYVQKDPATFEQTLSDALAQGTGPDMVVLTSDYAVKDEAKMMPIQYAQLSQVQFQSLFTEAANVYLGPNGISGIPFAIDPLVLYWNRDMLASAGFAEPPRYWEDLTADAPLLTVRDVSGQLQKSAIAFGTYQNIENAKADLSALLLQEGTPITTRNSTGLVASAFSAGGGGTTKQPSQDALALYTGFANPARPFYSWNGSMGNARSAFAAGDVAMYVGYASEASLIAATNPNLNFAIAALPQSKNASRSVDYGRVYAYAVPRVATNQSGAFLAAQLLDDASTTVQLANLLGIAPARRDALSLPASGYARLFGQMAIISRTWPDPDPGQTESLFRAMIEDTISGSVTVSEGVQRADQQMAHIVSPQ